MSSVILMSSCSIVADVRRLFAAKNVGKSCVREEKH